MNDPKRTMTSKALVKNSIRNILKRTKFDGNESNYTKNVACCEHSGSRIHIRITVQLTKITIETPFLKPIYEN